MSSSLYWNLDSDPPLSPDDIREVRRCVSSPGEDWRSGVQMTEWSSDEEDRRGRAGEERTPDDFDFDISSYTSQSNFFSR